LGLGTNAPTTAIDVFGSGIIGRVNGTSTNNAFLGFASAGTNKWSIGNVQADHRFRIYSETNTSELLTVLQTGEFGIGIANPTTKLHIDGGASALIANLDANVSVAKSISFRSDNSNRINLEVSGTESGSNAGADLFIRTYSDAGALLNTPLKIVRSTSYSYFATNVIVGGTAASRKLQVNTSGNDGIRISTSGDNPTLDLMQTAAANAGARNWRIVTNWEGWGTFDVQSGTTNTEDPATTRFSISGTTGNATFQNVLRIGSVGEDYVYITGGSGLGSLIQLRTATAGIINTRLSGNLDNYVNASTGNFGVGKTNPGFKLDVDSGTSGSVANFNSNRTGGGGIILMNNSAARLYMGNANWLGISGESTSSTAISIASAENSAIIFATNAAISPVERLRIANGGDLYTYQNTFLGNTGTGSTTPNTHTFYSSGYFQSSYMVQVNHKGTGPSYTYMHDWFFSGASGSWSSGTGQQFLRCRDDQNRLIIYESGNVQNYNNSYGSLSDIKIKENIVDATPKLDKLMQVRIVNYNKIGDDTKQIGVIAQELEQIFPSMIEEFEDTKDIEVEKVDEEGNIVLDENGNPIMESKLEFLGTKTKSVKYSVFVPMLIKAMQEQQAQIEELKAKIK
jgi:hypothetical protein